MTVLVPLERIHDNPFQARQDYPNIEDLATAILAMAEQLPETLGLIHPPNGRLVRAGTVTGDTQLPRGGDWYVELAEGHRRLRAFQLLAGGNPDEGAEPDPDYGQMPVNLVMLSDQAMDDVAWDENLARKDLSPVEEARSLQRSLERFKLTQTQLAGRRRMGRSTVANKLRLLELPADLLRGLHEGVLSERHAMAYLPLLDIPQVDLDLVWMSLASSINFLVASYWPPRPETLRQRLLEVADLTADQVRTMVNTLKQRVEEARKRKWTEQNSPAPIVDAAAYGAPPYTTSARLAVGTLEARDTGHALQSSNPLRGLRAKADVPPPTDEEPWANPMPHYGQLQPIAAASEPEPMPQPAKAALDTSNVVITIRILRPSGKPSAFSLCINEHLPNSINNFYRGEYGYLFGTLEQALDVFFGGLLPLAIGEQGEQRVMGIGA
jgi:ParB/RepB/Spo0J family partition protein